MEEVEQRTSLFELNEKVDVTCLSLFATSNRAEDRDRDAVMLFDQSVDLYLVCLKRLPN